MGLKQNVTYSFLLTLSTYLVPLLVFPYISRVLGPENIGAIDAVEYVINYAIICSMMGLTTLGIREISRNKNNPESLNRTFSELFFLNAITTLIVLGVLIYLVFTIPDFEQRKSFFRIGIVKLLANLFWIEWFFKGMENFKYITLRSVFFRVVFIAAVFLLVKHSTDSILYYSLWVGVTVMNAICNWKYRRQFVRITFRDLNLKRFLKPFVLLGLFALFSAVYTQLNVTYLSFVADDRQVGFYTTSIRLYSVLIALFSTITGVMIPRISVLMHENQMEEVKRLVDKTFTLLFCFAFPMVCFMEIFAEDIILIFAGSEFLPAAFPMRIVMLQMFIIGAEQIFILQLLIPARKEKAILQSVGAGVAMCIIINLLVTSQLQSVGSALAWVGAEISVFAVSAYFVNRYISIKFPIRLFLKCAVWTLPLIGGGLLWAECFDAVFYKLFFAGLFFLLCAVCMANKFLQLDVASKVMRLFQKGGGL